MEKLTCPRPQGREAMELGFKPGWSGYITVLLLVSQDAGVPPETQMRVPGSTAVVFMSPHWESPVS